MVEGRREILLERMRELSRDGIDCQACEGTCCTCAANSMAVTPHEMEEIYRYVAERGWANALSSALTETIEKFGLDRPEMGDGRRRFLRRRYTCAFHHTGSFGRTMPGHKGCLLPPEIKPYGCLGFNPSVPGQRVGGACRSDRALLEERQAAFASIEAWMDEEIREALGIDWEKKSLPLALRERLEIARQSSPAGLPEEAQTG